MILFTSGCSFTYGEELENRKQAWPFVLGKMLNYDVINKGICSGSNEYIVRTTINFVTECMLNNISYEDLYIILGFTTENRKECWSNYYKRYVQIKVGRSFGLVESTTPKIIPYNSIKRDPVKGSKRIRKLLDNVIGRYLDNFESDEYFNMIYKMNLLILIEKFLSSYNIKHIFFNSLKDCELIVDDDNNTENVENYILIKKLFDKVFANNRNIILSTTMDNFCNDYPRAPLNHPLKEGHFEWAKYLYGKILLNE